MQKKAFTLVEMLIVIGIVLILAAILFPVFNRPHNNAPRAQCQSNLKQLGLGLLQYSQDYDEKFPPVGTAKWGWVNVTQPYLKSWQIYHCPSSKTNGQQAQTEYFYNSRWRQKTRDEYSALNVMILAGDGVSDSPPNASFNQLPEGWRQDSESPAYRHIEGANYLFADGHVKWMKPEKVTNDSPEKGNYTFRIK